jgi:hypothetical protein
MHSRKEKAVKRAPLNPRSDRARRAIFVIAEDMGEFPRLRNLLRVGCRESPDSVQKEMVPIGRGQFRAYMFRSGSQIRFGVTRERDYTRWQRRRCGEMADATDLKFGAARLASFCPPVACANTGDTKRTRQTFIRSISRQRFPLPSANARVERSRHPVFLSALSRARAWKES